MSENMMSYIPATPPFIERYLKAKEGIYKRAAEMDFVDGKIPAIEECCSDIEKKVCYMIATSHEYRKPNTQNSISFVKNYDWESLTLNPARIEGINKPVDEAKVDAIAKNMKKPTALIVVNQLNGIRPQTRGKSILFDGHHRLEAYKRNGWTDIPVYKGFYTGADSISKRDVLPKFPTNRRLSFAFDYDDTIDAKGSIMEDTVKVMRYLKSKGHLIILYTCRHGESLRQAEDFLKKNRIPYDEVNFNPDFSTGSSKLYADITVDNRAINVADVLCLMDANIPDWRK